VSLATTLTLQTPVPLAPSDTVELQGYFRVADRYFAADQTANILRFFRGLMDRRSRPQKKLDDRALRVRVHMLVPERGSRTC
jgi:hypothetical protein